MHAGSETTTGFQYQSILCDMHYAFHGSWSHILIRLRLYRNTWKGTLSIRWNADALPLIGIAKLIQRRLTLLYVSGLISR